jgi:Fibronectin type III domain
MTDMRWCPRLTRLAGTCLAAVLAGASAVLAAGGMTAAPGPAQPVVLTAMQARVLNPDPPTGPTATAGDGQLTVSWQPPPSDGGAAILGYDLYLGTSAHGESPRPVNGTLISGTSVVVTGLGNGTTYYLTVEAVNDAGLHSAASAEVSAAPATAISKPGSPDELTASPGNGQVTLSWQAPGSDGGIAISGYEIYLGTRPGGESSVPVNGTLISGTSVVVTGLVNGTTYYFTVAAVDQADRRGPASGEDSATPLAVAAPPSSATPASPHGGTAATAGVGGTGGTADGPASTAVLTPVPRLVVVSLAAVAFGATAGVLTLIARRRRDRPRPRPAAPSGPAQAGAARSGPGHPAGTGTRKRSAPWWEEVSR